MFFKKKSNTKDKFNSLDIAIGTILIHAAKMDGEYHEKEKKIILQFFRSFRSDLINDAEDLLIYCEKEEENIIEIQNLTKKIKQLEYNERLNIIETLIKIIYSDDNLHALEDRLLRKIAGLIYIEDMHLGEIKIKYKKNT